MNDQRDQHGQQPERARVEAIDESDDRRTHHERLNAEIDITDPRQSDHAIARRGKRQPGNRALFGQRPRIGTLCGQAIVDSSRDFLSDTGTVPDPDRIRNEDHRYRAGVDIERLCHRPQQVMMFAGFEDFEIANPETLMLLVGSVFLVTTATVYGLFMVGVFNVLVYAEYLPWMYWVVALFALTFGLVNIKDYFWFRRGFSFTIDDRHKPGIFRRFRELIAGGRSPAALAGATLVMALGIALIELPCTAGFPVIWSGLLSAHDVNPVAFAGLLAVYLAIYLLDELVVFGLAAVKLRIDRFEERQARVLKLVGGTVMIALAVVLIVEPDIMSDVGPALGVFLVAFAAAGLIVVLHRYLLPRLGIQLGNGDGR